MIPAYLTIDDIPSAFNTGIVDYLCKKRIRCVMFAWGEFLAKNQDKAVYALQRGMLVQNHSYSHPCFADLTFEQAVAEIEKNEILIEETYRKAEIVRPFKLFRFPFGNKGGANEVALQQYLREKGFVQLESSAAMVQNYAACGIPASQSSCADTLWTFDFCEYRVRPESGFTIEDSLKIAEARFGAPCCEVPECGAAPEGAKAEHIVLIHDHAETEAMHSGYFTELVEALLRRNVRFVEPARQVGGL